MKSNEQWPGHMYTKCSRHVRFSDASICNSKFVGGTRNLVTRIVSRVGGVRVMCVRATSRTPHHMVHSFPLSPTQDGDASGIGHSYSHLYDTTSCFLCQSNKSSMVSYSQCGKSHLKAQCIAISKKNLNLSYNLIRNVNVNSCEAHFQKVTVAWYWGFQMSSILFTYSFIYLFSLFVLE